MESFVVLWLQLLTSGHGGKPREPVLEIWRTMDFRFLYNVFADFCAFVRLTGRRRLHDTPMTAQGRGGVSSLHITASVNARSLSCKPLWLRTCAYETRRTFIVQNWPASVTPTA